MVAAPPRGWALVSTTVAALHRTLGQLQTQQAIEEPGEQL